jgi:hypothetical protein
MLKRFGRSLEAFEHLVAQRKSVSLDGGYASAWGREIFDY